MSWLTLNGIEIELALGSGKRDTQIIGERRRAFDGTMISSGRAMKDGYDCTTTLMARDDADALYAFLMGYGHNWKFAAALDYYSGKGLKDTANTGPAGVTAGTASGKFDKCIALGSTENVTWTPAGYDSLAADYTIACWWLYDDDPARLWKHILVRRSGTTLTYYTDGVLDDTETGTPDPGAPDGDPVWDAKMSITAGVLKLLGEVTADTVDDAFSDLLALPFAVPTTWIAQMAAYARSVPNRPHVEVAGDMVNRAVTNPLTCCVMVDSFVPVPFVNSSGEQLDGGRISFRLEEV